MEEGLFASESPQLTRSSNRKLKRKNIIKKRFQPYSNNRNNHSEQTQQTPSLGETESLFGPIPTSDLSSFSSSASTMFEEGTDHDAEHDINSSLLLRDNELLDEFDSFMLNTSHPAKYLSSPPPSPTLSFQDLSGNNDDIGFDDFPLFS